MVKSIFNKGKVEIIQTNKQKQTNEIIAFPKDKIS